MFETVTEPYLSGILSTAEILYKPLSLKILAAILVVLLMLISSALISGSEVAFFSLGPNDIESLRKSRSRNSALLLRLIDIPERLLATILVANNFINIGIVIISAFITSSVFDFSQNPAIGFIIQVVVITFLILLFGEILPKIYAHYFSLRFAKFMSRPLNISVKIFRPLSSFLISSTSFVKRKFPLKKMNISMDELSDALELSEQATGEDKSILEGIVKFVNIYVREIMTSRMDIVGAGITLKFRSLIELIVESGYSRIPVYDRNFDNIKGILYIKDLLPHIQKPDSFNWQSLIRPPYYVPETKKIDDLLKEFQTNKIHLAVVVDEYGGTSGIITLEDILEEIVGEITDETDEDETLYTQIDDNTFVFEGKAQLNDFYKIFNLDEHIFDDVKGDADTLAGLILEIKGEFPGKNDLIRHKDFEFKIIAVDKRRIRKIQVTFVKHTGPEDEQQKK
ncbi:MAG: gliding motility-associated protein GldE [Bacteroidales bacterium]|nr:gliding motility-associated protein GldE [Bacteroidales bacterium]